MNPAVNGEPGNKQARSLDEIKPLIEWCKAGHLFAVQNWIAEGRPVNLPPLPRRSNHARSPLDIAIEKGFHSLVEVLLKGGAAINIDDWNGSMSRAIQARRFDIVKLLVEHGFDPREVDMEHVFSAWDPELMEYFIEKGADVETENPLARALCNRIRTAIRIFKRYRERFPSFQEQANIALRYHCREGNLKWVSLLLWAGADPYAPGISDSDEQHDPSDEGLSAVGFAVLYEHFEIFKLKKIKLAPSNPAIKDVLIYADHGEGLQLLKRLLEMGLDPNDHEYDGRSMIQSVLDRIGWDYGHRCSYSWDWGNEPNKLDTDGTRGRIKAIHLLAKHGAKWAPKDQEEIKRTRRSLLKLTSPYTLEFAWIMSKYRSCAKECIEDLTGAASMKKHLSKHKERLQGILTTWP